MILELKDKVRTEGSATEEMTEDFTLPVGETRLAEAMAALLSLGYSATEVEPVLRRSSHCTTAEETIRFALHEFAGGK